jgi:hypothetical protein
VTNDELWDQEIENLRGRANKLIRDIRSADDVSTSTRLAIVLSDKLNSARKGRFMRIDYLTWKLAYDGT